MKATTQAILSALANADKGEISGLPLWEHLYSEESVRASVAAFSDHCRAQRIVEENGAILSLSVHAGAAAESLEVIGELLNFLLQHSLQARWQKVQPNE
jgi:hypothetical protein